MKDDSLENLTVHLERDGFRLALASDFTEVENLLALLTGRAKPERYFRQGRRRNVMLSRQAVIKFYDFHKFTDLLRSGRYAPREVECYHDYVKAFGQLEGIRLPRLLGYFEKRFFGPFYRSNGLISEYMPDTHELTLDELMRTVPLFAHLYRRGIYHPDMQFKNVLFHTASSTVIPIDYMGCNILSQPNWEALLIMLARFLRTGKVLEEPARAFLNNVLAALPDIHITPDRAWDCICKLHQVTITTHQYHHPIFLPDDLRRQVISG